jgi:hypothetical protein
MKRAAAVLGLFLLAACSQTTTSSRPSPSASPSGSAATPSSSTPVAIASPTAGPTATAPNPNALFAVTESPSFAEAANKVVIVGLDGVARSRAQFQPRSDPVIPTAGVVTGPVAEVVGSKVYYLDGNGVVRVLRTSGQSQVVATLPALAPQSEAWFSVSPDGSQIIVGVVTFPDQPTLAVGGTGPIPVVFVGGPSKFDLYISRGGAAFTSLQHVDANHLFGDGDPKPTLPIGWTSSGPAIMEPNGLLYTATTGSDTWFGGSVYAIDTSGQPAAQLGGSDCLSTTMWGSGLLVCNYGTNPTPRNVEVRDQSGNVLWKTQTVWQGGYVLVRDARRLTISPDGQGVADGSRVETHAHGVIGIPPGFVVEGWLDNNTIMGRPLIGAGPDLGNLAWINLSDPTNVHDLGFKGDFVATLS